jgi:hypothetical protein
MYTFRSNWYSYLPIYIFFVVLQYVGRFGQLIFGKLLIRLRAFSPSLRCLHSLFVHSLKGNFGDGQTQSKHESTEFCVEKTQTQKCITLKASFCLALPTLVTIQSNTHSYMCNGFELQVRAIFLSLIEKSFSKARTGLLKQNCVGELAKPGIS